jgi:quercetin dioxygenase-like cupin family protein
MNIKDEHSDDAVNIAPDVHHIIYEDDMVRVLKVSMQPGGSTEMHWHPRNINYILSGV